MKGQESLDKRLLRLRTEAGLSQEALAFRAWDAGRKISAGAIGQFERGITRPTPETIEALAGALGVEPEVFAEYRLAQMRRLFDEREVGLELAVRNLGALAALLEQAPAPPGELGRRMKAAMPSKSDPGESQTQGAARQRSREGKRRQ